MAAGQRKRPKLRGLWEAAGPFDGELRPRPLRLLFMACSPTNLATLDYEREEDALFRAIYDQAVAFDSCDLGTFEEFKERVSEFKPHIAHLTGYGAIIDGQAASHSRKKMEQQIWCPLRTSADFWLEAVFSG
jgi:hypothetical protein